VIARAVCATVAVALLAGCGGHREGTPLAPPPPATTPSVDHSIFRGNPLAGAVRTPGFALRDQGGRLVRIADERGRVALVTFLYTRCPDVCPVIASNLNVALRLLGERARDVRVLAVSVDPSGDTPRAVRRFVAEHRLLPQFRYLTGSRARLQPVWQAYNVLSTPRSGTAVAHSAYTVLVDRRGRMRASLDAGATPAMVAHDVRVLLDGA
jgi:protein SCO1/2